MQGEPAQDTPPTGENKSHLVGYFRETTVHGFRYVVDGKTILQRLAWVLAIFVAFACATYMSHNSFKEAEENPIVTSVKVLTPSHVIKNIPFPAVTVLAGGANEKDPPFRLVTDMLDTLRFDCSKVTRNVVDPLPDCALETVQIRSDFKPLIKNTIRTVYDISKREISKDTLAISWVTRKPFEDEVYANNLLEAFCRVDATVFNSTNSMAESTLNLLVDNFMVDRSLYRNSTLDYVRNFKSKQELIEETTTCSYGKLKTLEIKATLHTMLLLDLKTYDLMSPYNSAYLSYNKGGYLGNT